MDIQNILKQLRQQRGRLDDAIAALEGGHIARRRGRPPKTSASQTVRRGRRRMSTAARAKIAAAQRARWARQKRQATTPKKASSTAKKAGRRPWHMSTAARKKLSNLMKARWAARKKQQ